jgi:peptidoglycan/LPS O-acetylase OafA/YrhL
MIRASFVARGLKGGEKKQGNDPIPAKNWQIVDLVRTFSIVAVLADHSFSNPIFQQAWVAWLWGRFCVNGSNGVLIFFVVSGFLITNVIARSRGGLFDPDPIRFYVHRIGRIWPLYFTLFFIGLAVLIGLDPHDRLYGFYFPQRDLSPWFLLSIPTFTFNWFFVFHSDLSLGFQWIVLWSLSIEEQFYLFYPLILKWAGKFSNFMWVAGSIFVGAVLFRVVLGFWGPINNFILSFPTPAELDLFIFGILLFLVFERSRSYLSPHPALCWFLCLSGFALGAAAYLGVYPKRTWGIALFPDALGLGVFGFILGGLNLTVFESRLLKALSLPGKYCYGSYLLHPLVLFLCGPFLPPNSPFLRLFVFVVLTTALSGLSFHYFEVPVNRAIRANYEAKRKIQER